MSVYQILYMTLLLTCFGDFSLKNYSILKRMENPGKSEILSHIVDDSSYRACLKKTLSHTRYDEINDKKDVKACSLALYPIIAKKPFKGNEVELEVNDTEHTIVEIAAIETVFLTLKKYGCFLMRLKLHLR